MNRVAFALVSGLLAVLAILAPRPAAAGYYDDGSGYSPSYYRPYTPAYYSGWSNYSSNWDQPRSFYPEGCRRSKVFDDGGGWVWGNGLSCGH